MPYGKIVKLKNCYYILVLIRNIIYIPLLLEQDYEINFKSNGYSIFYLRELYENRKVVNGLIILKVNDNIFHVEQVKEGEGKI